MVRCLFEPPNERRERLPNLMHWTEENGAMVRVVVVIAEVWSMLKSICLGNSISSTSIPSSLPRSHVDRQKAWRRNSSTSVHRQFCAEVPCTVVKTHTHTADNLCLRKSHGTCACSNQCTMNHRVIRCDRHRRWLKLQWQCLLHHELHTHSWARGKV